jgi:hypothetical protein
VSSSPTEIAVEVTMPQMGVSVAEGTIVAWKKAVGDWVDAGPHRWGVGCRVSGVGG